MSFDGISLVKFFKVRLSEWTCFTVERNSIQESSDSWSPLGMQPVAFSWGDDEKIGTRLVKKTMSSFYLLRIAFHQQHVDSYRLLVIEHFAIPSSNWNFSFLNCPIILQWNFVYKNLWHIPIIRIRIIRILSFSLLFTTFRL